MIAKSLTGKKQKIVRSAVELFASVGFHGTTTAGIAEAAGTTEPLIYYHFKDKDALFTWIIDAVFNIYFARLATLEPASEKQFDSIAGLINLHLDIVAEMPRESSLIINSCPSRLRDPEHICFRNVQNQRNWLQKYLTRCVEAGVANGEFRVLPVQQTVYLITAYLNGLLRQSVVEPFYGKDTGILLEAVTFLKRGLVN